jgi:DNA-binding NtrC family response regulator
MRKKKANIVVVDDDKDILFSTRAYLRRFFETITTIESPRKLIKFLAENDPDVILLDMNYNKGHQEGKEGLYWLKYIKENAPEVSVILMTAFGDVSLAVEGIKKGASDFILKPWNNDKLYASVNLAVDLSRSKRQNRKQEAIQKAENESAQNQISIIGESKQIKKAVEICHKVAKTDANVLILGENGTGKYVFAREIYKKSDRKDKPFIHVDLGSLNENIFESELFGYAKGAFTDAKENKAGRFEHADEGTIFLDEIGNLSLTQQSKLLTVLQNKKVVRLGETKERQIDVRIICATNANLHEMVINKEFRQDLLYRINTVEITLPPLRKRKGDIKILALYFLDKYRKKYRNHVDFSEDAVKEMEKYTWPGNIRELDHIVERAVIMCEDKITKYELQFSPILEIPEETASLNLEEVEKNVIQKAMIKNRGNISDTAKELGLTRASLYRRLDKYNI